MDIDICGPTETGVSRDGTMRPMTNKLFSKSQFINSFFHTEALLMTHRGGLSLSIIIWRIGLRRGAKFPFALEPNNSLGGPVYMYSIYNRETGL